VALGLQPTQRTAVPGPKSEIIDLGPLIGTDDLLDCELILINPTNREVPVKGAESLKPCCLAIASVPEVLPPRGQASVGLRFRPGTVAAMVSGRVQIRAGAAGEFTWLATVRSTVRPKIEAAFAGGSVPDTLAGRPLGATLRVTQSALSPIQPLPPSRVEATEPLAASTVATRIAQDGPFHQSVVELAIKAPASREIGIHAGEIRLEWPDGTRHTSPVSWMVEPAVRLEPEHLTLRPGATSVLLLTSSTGPFRVVGIEGPEGVSSPDSLPTATATTHRLRLVFDPGAGGARALRLALDHPDQPEAVAHLLLVPPAPNEARQ
jgi:hypothetical protein